MRFDQLTAFQAWLLSKGHTAHTAYQYSRLACRTIEAFQEPPTDETLLAYHKNLTLPMASIFPTVWRRLVQFGREKMGKRIPNPFGNGQGPI